MSTYVSYFGANTVSGTVKNCYWMGAGVVASAMFLGNVYFGFRIAQRKLNPIWLFDGFICGLGSSSYGFFSWAFPAYALYRHVYRRAIAQAELAAGAEYPKNLLSGHVLMHFIPGIHLLMASNKPNDVKLLTDLGILETPKDHAK